MQVESKVVGYPKDSTFDEASTTFAVTLVFIFQHLV
jgi:hypothetical protein